MKKFWIITGLIIFLGGAAWGQATYTWNGLGNTDNWSSPTYWTPGIPSSTDNVSIQNGTINLDGDVIVAGITVDANASITSGVIHSISISGNAVFNGGATGAVWLAISVNATFNADIDAAAVTVMGTSAINADIITTGTQLYNGAVMLGGGNRILSNGVGMTISLGMITGGGNGLSITAGTVTLNGGSSITTLTVNGLSTINANITTTGTQTYNDAVTLGSGAISLTAGGALTLSGDVTGGGGTISLTGNGITGAGIANAGNAVNLTTTGGAVNLTGQITGSTLEVNAHSGITLGGNNQISTSATLYNNNGTAPYSGNISFTNTSTGTLGLTATNGTAGNGDTGTTGTINITHSGTLTVNGVRTTAGAITLSGANGIGGTGLINTMNTGAVDAPINLTSSGGSVSDSGVLTGSTLEVNAHSGITLGGSNQISTSVTLNNNNGTTPPAFSGGIIFNNANTGTLGLTAVNGNATAATGTITVTHAGTLNVSGVSSATGSIELNGNIEINVNANISTTGTGTTITLQSSSGAVGKNTTAVITAPNLAVNAHGGITLGGTGHTGNNISTSATLNNNYGTTPPAFSGGIVFNNANTGTLGLTAVNETNGTTGTISIAHNGILTVNGINTNSNGSGREGPGVASIYIDVDTLAGSGSMNPGTSGEVCVYINTTTTYTGSVTGGRIHYHSQNGKHLVYRTGADTTTTPRYAIINGGDQIDDGTYVYIRADNNLGAVLNYSTAGNIYIIDVGDNTNANSRAVNFSAGGRIEIRGDYTSSGALNLTPGSSQSVYLNNNQANTSPASLVLTPSFSLSAPLVLLGGTGTDFASITAAGITLGGTVEGTTANGNNLTLAGGGAAISVTGPVGDDTPLGDIEVSSSNTATGAVTFTGAVTANSYTQTGTGSTIFGGLQRYSGANTNGNAFEFTGTNLTTGAMGASGSGNNIGNIYINSANTIVFGGIIYAASFTQDAGTATTFSSTQNYTGAFSFTGAALTVNNDMDVGGTTTITNSGLFTKNSTGAISSDGALIQNGAGTNTIDANITVTTSAAQLRFTTDIIIAPADDDTVVFTTNNGPITLVGAVSSAGTNHSLTLASGTGRVTLNDTVTLSGSFRKTGTITGTSDIYNNITAGTNAGTAYEINFAGPVLIKNTANSGITLDASAVIATNTGSITIAGFIDGGAKNLTLNASGNISLNGKVGVLAAGDTTATSRLGTLQVSSAADAEFSNAIWAANFIQLAGTGTTTFNGAQDYTAGFSFTGSVLTINASLETDTDSAGADGAIDITNSGLFTVGASGEILPRGTGGTITVSGETENYGTITAAALLPAGADAILFEANYSGKDGNLNGNGTNSHYINFYADAELGKFTHSGDIVVFNGAAGTSHAISQNYSPGDLAANKTLGRVEIRAGNRLDLNGNIVQDTENRTITPVPPYERVLFQYDNSVIDTGGHNWFMGAETAPAGFQDGFYGYRGGIVFNSDAELTTTDFYTEQPNSDVLIGGDGINIFASGNVTVNKTFSTDTAAGYFLHNSTITMTGGNLSAPVRLTVHQNAGMPAADIGNFTVNGVVAVNSDLRFKGKLTIGNGRELRGGANYIYIFPMDGTIPIGTPSNVWEHVGNGRFIHDTSTVEFGDRANVSPANGHLYHIKGINTDWYNLVCHEDKAEIGFSRWVDNGNNNYHSIHSKLTIKPVTFSDSDNNVSGIQNAIKLSRIEDGAPPPYPNTPGPEWLPPATINTHFWSFYLRSTARMEINYVIIEYSYSATKIPVPRNIDSAYGFYVSAWPYVAISNTDRDDWGNYAGYTGILTGDGNTAFLDYVNNRWNVDWFVMNSFFYAYTEDSNHNGRIDRLRLQAAFNVNDNFNGFAVTVKDYTTGIPYTVRGYRRVQEDETLGNYDLDSIYVLLEEKEYSDTGAVLHWQIDQNENLKDLATGTTKVGNPPREQEMDPDQDLGITGLTSDESLKGGADTAPPRVNYAFALPGYDEIFFQMSESVTVDDINVIIGDFGINSPLNLHKNLDSRYDREFVIQLGQGNSYTVSELASGTRNFTLSGVHDLAIPAFDLNMPDPNNPYAYMYPRPKYPQNYNYDDASGNGGMRSDGTYIFQSYVPVSGHTPVSPLSSPVPARPGPTAVNFAAPANRSYDRWNTPPTASPMNEIHRVTDLLISRPPATINDPGYFVWPLWARYEDRSDLDDGILGASGFPGYGYMGKEDNPFNDSDIIWDFTGKRFLERDNIVLQARLNTGQGLSGTPSIIPVFNVSGMYKSTAVYGSPGLWHNGPTSLINPLFVNMVPQFYLSISDRSPFETPSPLFNYKFLDGTDYSGNGTLEFFFRHLPQSSPADLLSARLDIVPGGAIPDDWYRRVKPFSFGIHGITRQRSGVTILNNVINSERRERVFLDYQLRKPGRVTIQVFALDGTMIKVLENRTMQASERFYRVSWDGTNNGGRPVARGMYFIRIVGPDIDEIRKVMVVK